MSTKTKNIITIIICFIPALVAILTYVVVLNTLTIDGKKLSSAQKKKNNLEQEIQNLNYELAKLGTISKVQEKAVALGMQPVAVSFANSKSPKIAFSD